MFWVGVGLEWAGGGTLQEVILNNPKSYWYNTIFPLIKVVLIHKRRHFNACNFTKTGLPLKFVVVLLFWSWASPLFITNQFLIHGISEDTEWKNAWLGIWHDVFVHLQVIQISNTLHAVFLSKVWFFILSFISPQQLLAGSRHLTYPFVMLRCLVLKK